MLPANLHHHDWLLFSVILVITQRCCLMVFVLNHLMLQWVVLAHVQVCLKSLFC